MNTTTHSLEVTRLIPARRDEVFQAWTVRDRMNWYCPGDMFLLSATADVRVGGSFRETMQGEDGKVHVCSGTYLEIVPNERLVFTQRGDGKNPVETLVTVEFIELDAGTVVALRQEGFEEAEDLVSHEENWETTLQNLEAEFSPGILPPS
ncbi:MAG TPA: SRPBCC domain-containing protein [Planctomycetota bacterium]|nr:SRPBCC domain-containing protein [Planctomycetota bacterium]